MSTTVLIIITTIVYLAVMIAVGHAASRRFTNTSESYYLADRGLHRFVLIAAIFGTNMTAFVMLGLAGGTRRGGVALWVTLAPVAFLIIPFTFYFGYRCWLVAKAYGYVTPVEFYRERFSSNALAILLFLSFTGWTVPYVLTGIVGAGRAFDSFTGGAIPPWAAGLAVVLVVGYYTLAGGMGGTAWTNTIQVVIFLGFLLLTVLLVPFSIGEGGASAVLSDIRESSPELLTSQFGGVASYGNLLSQTLLFAFIIFTFPFVWMRMISARTSADLRFTGTIYPVALMVTWGAAVVLGLWGVSLVPGLEGPAADNVIFALTGQYLPQAMAIFGLVALMAIIMSSMDAQVLTISNMVSWDFLARYRKDINEAQSVFWTRVFVVVFLALLYALSLIELPAIFDLATFAFTGFIALSPIMVGGIFWRRGNRHGAIASLLVAQGLAVAGFLGWYPVVAGLQPVVWAFVGGWLTYVVVSLLTPADDTAAERFHRIWDDANSELVTPGRGR